MSLKHAILVLLERSPSSGYDLAQRFKSGIGNFWNASHQQVYQELKRLHEAHLVDYQLETQTERPDKKVYRITRAGKKAAAAWVAEPVDPPVVRDALLVKLYGAELVDDGAILAELDRHIAVHETSLAEYEAREEAYLSADEATRRRMKLPYLTLRRGIRYVRGTVEWLRETRDFIAADRLPKSPVPGKSRRG